jgi:uncharacterized membrane protein YidH (DUF202 family)
MTEDAKNPTASNRRVHLANERTFLAWIRTSIGIMAFGFVVEKFALFIKEISHIIGKSGMPQAGAPVIHGYSSAFGILLVGLGAGIGLLAFFRFQRVEREIEEDAYHSSPALVRFVTAVVLAIGVFLVIYLIKST